LELKLEKNMNNIKVLEALKEVNDPEIPLNVVDLGLIKGISCNEYEISIKMTLTTPKCPLENFIVNSVKDKLQEHFPDRNIEISLEFDEPWNTSMISEKGKEKLRKLGWKI
jgi:metal-sulfur cluster biosynthetic enzyme